MKTLPFIFISLIVLTVNAQDYHKIDSLKSVLSATPELNGTDADTSRMKIIVELGKSYEKFQADSALFWYFMIADTLISEEFAIKFPKRTKIIMEANEGAGIIYFKENQYHKAKPYFEKYLDLAMIAGDKKALAKILFSIGNIYYYQNDFETAIIYYERSLKIAEEYGYNKEISYALNNIAYVEYNQGNNKQAIEHYERALVIANEIGDPDAISSCNNNIGLVLMAQGNYFEARDYFEKSLKIDEQSGNKKSYGASLNNLGIMYKNISDYPKAISYFEESLKIKEEVNDKYGISSCLNNLGNVAMDQGNYVKASEYIEKSLKIAEEIQSNKRIVIRLNNLGIISVNQGDFIKAISYYERALKIAREIGDRIDYSSALNNMGNLYFRMENYSVAKNYFDSTLVQKEELGDIRGVSLALMNIGNIYVKERNLYKAVEYYEASLKLKKQLNDKANMATDYSVISRTYSQLDEPEKALPYLCMSKELTISLLKENFMILPEKDKDLYLNRTKGVFNDFHFYNMNFPEYRDSISGICYNNELILKGLLLKSSSAIMDVVYSSQDPEITDSFFLLKQYREKISSLQGSDNKDRDSLIADLENKANDQERKLVKLSSEFAGIENLFEYKWEDVQKNIKSGEAAIEFVNFSGGIGGDTTFYVALIITKECRKPIAVKLFEESELQNLTGKSTGTGIRFISSIYGENGNELYHVIWKPMEPALKGINTVYYTPVGALNKISFAALSKEPGRMLCDDYNLFCLSTTGKLINPVEQTHRQMTAAVFGGIDYNTDSAGTETWNYLPGTLTEKEIIEKLFREKNVTYCGNSGKEASEEKIKGLFAENGMNPSIIHISTHGFFFSDPEQDVEVKNVPDKKDAVKISFRGTDGSGLWMFVKNKNPMMRTGLVLAGANRIWSEDWSMTENEGILSAYEVSNMNMRNTDLVVLSACETGLGDIRGSEGVYGLQRAFKMAGVKYIIMSLWQVPDKETVEFMEMFYKKLLNEKDVRQAFNETQKEMRKKYNPYYWAAFVLIE